jgi:hypothetical protein
MATRHRHAFSPAYLDRMHVIEPPLFPLFQLQAKLTAAEARADDAEAKKKDLEQWSCPPFPSSLPFHLPSRLFFPVIPGFLSTNRIYLLTPPFCISSPPPPTHNMLNMLDTSIKETNKVPNASCHGLFVRFHAQQATNHSFHCDHPYYCHHLCEPSFFTAISVNYCHLHHHYDCGRHHHHQYS